MAIAVLSSLCADKPRWEADPSPDPLQYDRDSTWTRLVSQMFSDQETDTCAPGPASGSDQSRVGAPEPGMAYAAEGGTGPGVRAEDAAEDDDVARVETGETARVEQPDLW